MFDKMNVHRTLRLFALLTLAYLLAGPAFASNILTNGNFATGNLTGWTPFVTANGTNGAGLPDVVSFDTTGNGASFSAHFNVGKTDIAPGGEGGGLAQTFFAPIAGLYTETASIATYDPGGDNADSGTFSILVDESDVASEYLGNFMSYTQPPLRGTLDGTVFLTEGEHTFEIMITRNFATDNTSPGTPDEYVTNLTLSPVPEPGSIALLLAGGLGLLAYAWRRRRQAALAKA